MVMTQLRTSAKTEKIVFPVMVTIVTSLIVPGSVWWGMLAGQPDEGVRCCGPHPRRTAGNELMNIITIFLALSVGCTTSADSPELPHPVSSSCWASSPSLGRCLLVLRAEGDVCVTGGQVKPADRFSSVCSCPMHVSRRWVQSENPQNFLPDARRGPVQSGVIGSAVAAGILINIFG